MRGGRVLVAMVLVAGGLTACGGDDPAVLERLRAILVRAQDLPSDAGWIEEPEPEGEADVEVVVGMVQLMLDRI
ncbi:MAG: hypothetical protein ACK5CE_10005 [Actinomycetes bacterium]|jgi:hypothetical protein